MIEYTQEDLLELFLDLHEKLVQLTELSLQDSRFRNLSRHDFRILKVIGLNSKKTMGETAAELRVTLGTLTVSVKRLEKKGYVERNRDLDDQRRVVVSLTQEGSSALRLYLKMNRVLAERALAGTDESESKLLYNYLNELRGAVFEDYITYKKQKVEAAKVRKSDSAHKPVRAKVKKPK